MNEEAKKQWMALHYINDSDYEREIDLLDCIFQALDKWRSLVLIGLAALVLVGGFKFYKAEQSRAEKEVLFAEGKELELVDADDYQEAQDTLQKKKTEIRKAEAGITTEQTKITELNNKIENSEDKIASLEESIKLAADRKVQVQAQLENLNTYMDNSVLMQIDANAKPSARRRYQVVFEGGTEATEELFRDPCDEIVSAYTQNITLNGEDSDIGEKYGIDRKYMDELFSVSTDLNANTIYVNATGRNEAMANDILYEVCQILEGKTKEISARYHAHTLTTALEHYFEYVDESLLQKQADRISQGTEYQSLIQDYENEINTGNTNIENTNALIDSYNTQIADSQQAIAAYEDTIAKLNREKEVLEGEIDDMIEAKRPSKKASVKAAIKAAVIGAIIAVILLGGIYVLMYLLGGKLHTATDLTSVYAIPLFAVLNHKDREKQNWIDQLLRKLFRRVPVSTDEEILRTAAVSVEECVEEKQKIALLSTCGKEALEKTAAALGELVKGKVFVPITGAYANAESARKLSEMEAVIVYETREESALNDIDEEIQQAVVLNKPVLGCIIA